MHAPWNSDYHPNVNLQINYWAAEGAGLPECVEPLADWLMALVPSGRRTAEAHYRARSWVLHHISDIFGCTTPMDGPWGLWPFGGAWLCRNLYEHYLYGGDKAYFILIPNINHSLRWFFSRRTLSLSAQRSAAFHAEGVSRRVASLQLLVLHRKPLSALE